MGFDVAYIKWFDYMNMAKPTIAIINLTFGDGLDHPFMFKGKIAGKPHI